MSTLLCRKANDLTTRHRSVYKICIRIAIEATADVTQTAQMVEI